jgi:hypothetical protein
MHGGRAADGDVVDGVVMASTSVEKFIKRIAAAPRSTAKLSPRVVAMAPRAFSIFCESKGFTKSGE